MTIKEKSTKINQMYYLYMVRQDLVKVQSQGK